ncbi:MAG TPA: hypothetical protein VF136_11010 [Methylomirabilota bacterium]
MLLGLNAGFGAPLGAELELIHGLGFAFVRQDLRADASDAVIRRILADHRRSPVGLLALLAGGEISHPSGRRVEPHELAAHGARVVRLAAEAGVWRLMIEVGNEPDIGHVDYRERPQDFAVAVRYTVEAVRQAGYGGVVISGGISNLSPRALRYLERMCDAGLPDGVAVGFHRYPRGMGPRTPQRGFRSREAEWEALGRVAAGRPVACTELGHHTAPRPTRFLGIFPVRRRVSDQAVADHMEYDLRFFAERGCLLTAVFQWNDGPRPDLHVDRYGLRRRDGSLKPVAARIAAISRAGWVPARKEPAS